MTHVPYEEMLFFDDEARNKNVEELGVVMQLVRDGVTRGEVDRGVQAWWEGREGVRKRKRKRERKVLRSKYLRLRRMVGWDLL